MKYLLNSCFINDAHVICLCAWFYKMEKDAHGNNLRTC